MFARGFVFALLVTLIGLALAIAPMVGQLDGLDKLAAIGFCLWAVTWGTWTLVKVASGR